MAKELPYFKFEPNQWENGNIQMCSKESKGLFVDLCSSYWSRLGELPYALALQKHCNGSKDALQELIDCTVLVVNEGQIIIEFLDEQLSEFQNTSEKRRSAANKRWSNASALQMQSKSNAIRGEEIREDKKKEQWFIDWFNTSMKKLKKKEGKFKLPNKVKAQLHARIKEGYTSANFISAFEAISNDSFHQANNYKHLTPEFITRADKLEMWSNVEKVVEKNNSILFVS